MYQVEKKNRIMKKNWFFILLLSMAALSLAGTAAYFSVFGLTKLFYAAGLGITILAASLEFAKLVTVSYVYRFWKTIKKGLRGFYIFAVVFIMLLTSIGIYGFLTGAYQQSANKVEMRDSHIKIAENKKTLFVNQLDRVNKSIESSSERINTLSGLRTQQERRLDNLYNEKSVTSARRTESQIIGSDDQIKILNSDISSLMKQTNTINDSIAYYDLKISELKSSDVSNEIGPYKFVADLTGMPIGRIVNIVAILIVLVFDPLAIALLIGVNQLTMIDNPLYKKEEDDETEEDDTEVEPIAEPIIVDTVIEPIVDTVIEPIVNTAIEPIAEPKPEIESLEIETLVEPLEIETLVEPLIDNTQSFLDIFETSKEKDDIQQVASVSGRINAAHFIPNE